MDYLEHMLNECDLSGPEDILSESDDELLPTENVSESEDNLEEELKEDSDKDTGEEVSNTGEEFAAKSGRVWKTSVPSVIRRRRCNILKSKPGPTYVTANASTITDIFDLFIDKRILDIICKYTNAEACRIIQEWNAKCAPSEVKI